MVDLTLAILWFFLSLSKGAIQYTSITNKNYQPVSKTRYLEKKHLLFVGCFYIISGNLLFNFAMYSTKDQMAN